MVAPTKASEPRSRRVLRALIADELRIDPTRSNRMIAATVGTTDKTIAAVRQAMVATAEIPRTVATKGRDGRVRTIRESTAEISTAEIPAGPTAEIRLNSTAEIPTAEIPTELDDDARELAEERAAIMEFDGGLSRAEAEERAGIASLELVF